MVGELLLPLGFELAGLPLGSGIVRDPVPADLQFSVFSIKFPIMDLSLRLTQEWFYPTVGAGHMSGSEKGANWHNPCRCMLNKAPSKMRFCQKPKPKSSP